tara:strand:- start:5992 stop:6996 length:1005 start_codon:yes stop_codon:yes gene_type:complete
LKINSLPKEVFEAACNFKLLKEFQKYNCVKITDGVSSDIWYVKTEKQEEFCIKRALAKLTVKEDWYAPVNRSNFEAIYFKYCKKIAPENFPKILGHDNKKFILAMEWYNPNEFEVWKKKLLKKNIELKDAKNVSNLLLKKHKKFFNKKIYQKKFSNDDTFYSIRIEPYILFTSKKYPEFKAQFDKVAKSLTSNKKTLIHGDFSPKNILIKANKPVILDAETACWGDPIFDLAFCNNHLLLKSLLQNGLGSKFLHLSFHFINNYIKKITWEEKKYFTNRLFDIIPLLLLARIDGKSPVEYFNLKQKNHTRALAKEILNSKIKNLEQLYFICDNYV